MYPAKQNCEVVTNQRWPTAAILKIAKSPYLGEKASDFDKIWYTTTDIELDGSHVTIFLNSRWRTAAILIIGFLAISHQPIVRLQRNFVRGFRTACRQRPLARTAVYKIQDGGEPPL